ncbi:MAG: hypothetical protein JSW34_13105 [Candidatus Zixiibacteriota bacterium]|nr:MAG: hypothetical protein JSW34_13105 [candidate division Zixibacteria bacterium]
MRIIWISFLTCLLVAGGAAIAAAKSCGAHISYEHGHDGCTNIDFKNGTLVIKHENRYLETVEITSEYELYVNGDHVETTDEQKVLLREFYRGTEEIVGYATHLGWEGAKIGLEGARLGVEAVGNLFKLAFTSYDSEDFERDIECEASKIEAKAARLEDEAEVVEEMADDLEYVARKLRREIPRLRELDWF